MIIEPVLNPYAVFIPSRNGFVAEDGMMFHMPHLA